MKLVFSRLKYVQSDSLQCHQVLFASKSAADELKEFIELNNSGFELQFVLNVLISWIKPAKCVIE